MTLYEFDTLVTTVAAGYATAEDYYRSQSPKNWVAGIQVPFLVLNALDDPIASARGIPIEAAQSNPNLIFALTRYGGHLGWFRGTFSLWTKERWVVKPIIEWLIAMHEANPDPMPHPAVKSPRFPRIGDDMVMDPEDREIGFREVAHETITGGDDPTQESELVQGL